ncbi:MAG: HAMP domain-containing histidine kinase [Gammaproteobacteria bacterium]|nr:HAMP domain-containing histidine kinase [Gammaproteobacteria bacterium]
MCAEKRSRRFAEPLLRRRLAVALIGLALVAAALLGAAFWTAESRVESQSLAEQSVRPGDAEAAQQWARRRAARAQRERQLMPLLLAAIAATALLAWWASGYLARRTLAPMERLLERIHALDPERRGERLPVADYGELSVVAGALNGHMARLDALVERERAFGAAASHELRTPLAVIAGAAELLHAGAAAGDPALARIERAVVQAREMLEALLELSRGEAGAESARPLSLAALLPAWSEAWRRDGVELKLAVGERPLLAPPGVLAIVYTNLLRNALRVSRARVAVRYDGAELAVEDDGPGIAAQQLPRVLEPRFSGRDGGSGLGLFIADRLCRDRGWRLWLENVPQGGVRATVRFAECGHHGAAASRPRPHQ